MKRLLVLSDSHGRAVELASICAQHPEADAVIFLGDGADDVEMLQLGDSSISVQAVRGNNDFFSTLPDDRVVVVDGVRIFCTHGHRYSVKSTLTRLAQTARQQGCSIALFGHTHNPTCRREDGVWLINPGAVLSWPARYALVDLTDSGEPIVSLAKAQR